MPDLAAARESLPAFAAMLGHPLSDWQAADLELDAPITCLLWGRQLGKSRGLALRALWRAFGAPGRRVLVVSGSGELGARRLLGEVRSIATASETLAGSITDEQGQLLTLTNRSEIRSVAASEPSIRGWQVDELYLDEAQLLSESLLAAALPTVSAREGARVVLAGTASAASGGFYDLFRRGETGDEHVRSSRRVSRLVGGPDHAPWQQPSMIEAQMAAMSPLRADAEHRCVWASDADALFSRASIAAVTADFEIADLENLRGPARVLAGVDWGAVRDRSVLVAVGRLAVPGERLFGVACAKRWPAGAPLTGTAQSPGVVEQIAGSRAHFDTITMERNGLGEGCSQLLVSRLRERPPAAGGGNPPRRKILDESEFAAALERRHEPSAPVARSFVTRKNPVFVTAEAKAAIYSSLRLLIDQQRLLIPASAGELIRELMLLKVDLSPSGAERIEASSGTDDLCDALGLAQAPFPDRRGRWHTMLANLADPSSRLPEPRLPVGAEDLPTVTTGGGLSLPRRPIWQSPAGRELTVPPGSGLPEQPSALRLKGVISIPTHR